MQDLEKIKRSPGVDIGVWPTPVESIYVTAPGDSKRTFQVLVKRDDLSGHGRGGAKARKIKHLLGYMLAEGYDTLITVAGNVTNVVFDILPLLKQYDIAGNIFVLDEPAIVAAKRREIFQGVEDDIELISSSYLELSRKALFAYSRARRAGRRPLVVLPGIAHPASIAGNALGFIEMAEQLNAAGKNLPERVYITAATGSTIAGFLVAENALRNAGYPPVDIIGVQIYPGAIRKLTLGLIRWTERFLKLNSKLPRSRLRIDVSQLAGGFGKYLPAQSLLCKSVNEKHNFSLDPIFGGKTFYRLLLDNEAVDNNMSERTSPFLFWHCGYTPEWETLGGLVEEGKRSRAQQAAR